MIFKPLEAITLADLQRLVENRISEGKTIEYKLILPPQSNEEKIKFLRAASSIANIAGGDLLSSALVPVLHPMVLEAFAEGAF